MAETKNKPFSFQNFLEKRERKVAFIHEEACTAKGGLDSMDSSPYVDFQDYFQEVCKTIERLRKWRKQTKSILDSIQNKYPSNKSKEGLSVIDRENLSALIRTTAQEYVELNEAYEKLVFALEDMQSCFLGHEVEKDQRTITLSTKQSEYLLNLLEQLSTEQKLASVGKEILHMLRKALLCNDEDLTLEEGAIEEQGRTIN